MPTKFYKIPGTYTFGPVPVPMAILGKCYGAGGGGADGAPFDSGGGAGGGGGYNDATFNLAVGESLTIVVPAGGISGAVDGVEGGACTITLSTGSVLKVSAPGGGGGHNTSGGGPGGDAGTFGVGSNPQNGGHGGAGDSGGGGGGGCAGTTATGSYGNNSPGTTGGAGGDGGATGGGQGGDGGDSGLDGQPGHNPGGGGGGGGKVGGDGKDGGDGECIIEWNPGPKWEWTGCYCCDWQLPDHMNLATSVATLPGAPVGQCPPCAFGTYPNCHGGTSFSFAAVDGWTKVFNETVYPGGIHGSGISIVVPVAWKSVPIGPWENCPCYVTFRVWCNRDGLSPDDGDPSLPGYRGPGSWWCEYEWDDTCGYSFPGVGFPFDESGRPITTGYPCTFTCDVSVLPNGSFRIDGEGHGIPDIFTGAWHVFGYVPPCPI